MSLGAGAWENGKGTCAIQARQGGNHGNLCLSGQPAKREQLSQVLGICTRMGTKTFYNYVPGHSHYLSGHHLQTLTTTTNSRRNC